MWWPGITGKSGINAKGLKSSICKLLVLLVLRFRNSVDIVVESERFCNIQMIGC